MGKDPAFLFYPNDWLGGTIGMTFEEKGAYMELLMMQFNRGHMTEHMIGQVVGQNWLTLKSKFIQDENGLWYNERLDEEKNKRQAYTESRRNNKKGVNQFTKNEQKKVGHMTTHMKGHMENENGNENKDVISVGKEGAGEKPFQSKPEFVEQFGNYEKLLQDLTEKSGANEVLMMQNRINQKELENYATEFVNMLKSQKKFDGVKEERRYFTNWLPKRKQLNFSTGQEQKPQVAKLRTNKDLD